MMIRKEYVPGTPLTQEQIERLDDLKNHPIVYDEDCPEMTDEQLRRFKRVHPRTEQEEKQII